MLKTKKYSKKGFTLIEILVVIAIIAIIAAIAIPQYAAFRMRSYNAAAETDLRNFKTLIEGYYVEHNSYPAL